MSLFLYIALAIFFLLSFCLAVVIAFEIVRFSNPRIWLNLCSMSNTVRLKNLHTTLSLSPSLWMWNKKASPCATRIGWQMFTQTDRMTENDKTHSKWINLIFKWISIRIQRVIGRTRKPQTLSMLQINWLTDIIYRNICETQHTRRGRAKRATADGWKFKILMFFFLDVNLIVY